MSKIRLVVLAAAILGAILLPLTSYAQDRPVRVDTTAQGGNTPQTGQQQGNIGGFTPAPKNPAATTSAKPKNTPATPVARPAAATPVQRVQTARTQVIRERTFHTRTIVREGHRGHRRVYQKLAEWGTFDQVNRANAYTRGYVAAMMKAVGASPQGTAATAPSVSRQSTLPPIPTQTGGDGVLHSLFDLLVKIGTVLLWLVLIALLAYALYRGILYLLYLLRPKIRNTIYGTFMGEELPSASVVSVRDKRLPVVLEKAFCNIDRTPPGQRLWSWGRAPEHSLGERLDCIVSVGNTSWEPRESDEIVLEDVLEGDAEVVPGTGKLYRNKILVGAISDEKIQQLLAGNTPLSVFASTIPARDEEREVGRLNIVFRVKAVRPKPKAANAPDAGVPNPGEDPVGPPPGWQSIADAAEQEAAAAQAQEPAMPVVQVDEPEEQQPPAIDEDAEIADMVGG